MLRPAVGANAPRWDGASRGHYEVWYLTLADPRSGRGFWFRYTFDVPTEPSEPAVAELWGFAFEPGRPARGAKRSVPLVWPADRVMSVGTAVLEEGRARGDVGPLRWDVRWGPGSTAVWHIPGWLGRSSLPSTRVVCPTVDARVSGQVEIEGETVQLDGAFGCQTHLWGRQHAARWAWGHCSAFEGPENVLLEAVYAVPILGRGRAAPVGATLLYVEVEGEAIPCNAFPWVATARSRVESPRWELRGRTRDRYVRAVLEAEIGEMAQVTYDDPDGSKAWCANSEIARCALEVRDADGSLRRFESDGLAHVEFGAREPDPRVPLLC